MVVILDEVVGGLGKYLALVILDAAAVVAVAAVVVVVVVVVVETSGEVVFENEASFAEYPSGHQVYCYIARMVINTEHNNFQLLSQSEFSVQCLVGC